MTADSIRETMLIRRSIRKYEDRPVEWEKIERILRAGMHAPSALNRQPWEFLVLTDRASRNAISNMSPFSKMAAKAPVVILLLANQKREADERWLPQSMSACCQNILLQIAEEGLGGVWLGIYPVQDRMENLKKQFNLPKHILPFAAIPLGYSHHVNRPAERFSAERIFKDTYSDYPWENQGK